MLKKRHHLLHISPKSSTFALRIKHNEPNEPMNHLHRRGDAYIHTL